VLNIDNEFMTFKLMDQVRGKSFLTLRKILKDCKQLALASLLYKVPERLKIVGLKVY
jgi:hypothetical protein